MDRRLDLFWAFRFLPFLEWLRFLVPYMIICFMLGFVSQKNLTDWVFVWIGG